MLRSRIGFAYSLMLVLLLIFGCSSTPTVIEKPYPVYLPGVHDTIPLAQDTVYLPSDSNAYWEGNVEDSLNNVIGWLKVYYNRKIAELKLNPRTDTVIVNDTIPSEPVKIVETVYGILPSWAQIALMLIAGLLLYFSAKKQITMPFIDWIKKLWK